MKGKIIWIILVLIVTALNTWATYMTATYGILLNSFEVTIMAILAGIFTFGMGMIIIITGD